MSMRGRRAVVLVLDACGAGALPDAVDYGDAGTNTLAHLAEAAGGLDLPALASLGLGSVLPLRGAPPSAAPALHGRLHPLGPGKESTTGHWELMGVILDRPLPTYPGGFPAALLAPLERDCGRPVLGNRPYDGIAALERFGPEHLATGALIVYTSQDSVLQIAAHEDVLPVEALHALCARVGEEARGPDAVGRVIARPFTGAPGAFARTAGRRDFALPPPGRSYLEALRESGVPVHAVGKVGELFAGVGIDECHPAGDNAGALAVSDRLLRELDHGLVFTNLIETDQVYGHRKDVAGFHAALRAIDAVVAAWLERLGPEDLLILTADHGCDPAAPHSEHTREHAPLLALFPGHGGRRHDGPLADVGASVLLWLAGREAPELPGAPFVHGPRP